MDSPSKKIQSLVQQLEEVQNENARIHEALISVEETNQLLKDENDAVKDVNKQLRDMISGRQGFVPALPPPAPFGMPALPNPEDGKELTSAANDSALSRYPEAAMYADPYGYHSYGIPSHASYYQEMLQSHAKMEHDRYLEARELIVARAEQAQEELLKREQVLAEKEAAHKQHLQDREVLLAKSQQEWRPEVSAYASNQYPFHRSKFSQSRSPFAYEQTLLQKHRLDRSIKTYVSELDQLQMQRDRFDEELNLMVASRS